MSKGIDLAKMIAHEHAQAIEDMKDQLIIVLIKRLGGIVHIPATEIDNTASDNLMMHATPEDRIFHFEVRTE